jgi:hypothetical protein
MGIVYQYHIDILLRPLRNILSLKRLNMYCFVLLIKVSDVGDSLDISMTRPIDRRDHEKPGVIAVLSVTLLHLSA